ncbi:MAG TPA: serine hydrolase [Crocinitomicaceae bacterium]|nr:serine hydrolase [Crocinitomicaceae bacterium]
MKKKLRFLLKLLVILLVALNLIIILSGRFYLYKGVWHTYLHGKSGPSIYDLNIFHNRTVAKAKTPFSFHQATTNTTLSAEETAYFQGLETHSFMVIRNDSILFEKYFDQRSDTAHTNSFSAAKTVVGLLIGCALDEGKIKSLDDAVSDYIPDFDREGKEVVTIRDLLIMSSGLSWTESGKNPFSDNAASYYGTNLYNLAVYQKLVSKPAHVFNYQSGNTQLLGFVIKNATGKTVSEYASEKIWQKIGTENDAYWSLDKKDGDEKSFCCLYATTHDFAKLGRLILNKGKWNGETIISEKYMDEFLSPAKMMTDEGIENTRYGFQIWLYPNAENPVYYCRGILGQYIIALPKQNVIIVRTGMKRAENITLDQAGKDVLKVGHPKDLFEYLKIAKRILKHP